MSNHCQNAVCSICRHDGRHANFVHAGMQLGAQLATGQVFVSLFVVVPRMRFPLSCLASIFYVAAELLIAQDQHVGSHMQVTSAAAGTRRWPPPTLEKNSFQHEGIHQLPSSCSDRGAVHLKTSRITGCIRVGLQWYAKPALFRIWSCREQSFLWLCLAGASNKCCQLYGACRACMKRRTICLWSFMCSDLWQVQHAASGRACAAAWDPWLPPTLMAALPRVEG